MLKEKNTQNAKPKKTNIQQLNLNLNQHPTSRTAPVCVYHCAQLLYTTQHRIVLTISLLSYRQSSLLRGGEGVVMDQKLLHCVS